MWYQRNQPPPPPFRYHCPTFNVPPNNFGVFNQYWEENVNPNSNRLLVRSQPLPQQQIQQGPRENGWGFFQYSSSNSFQNYPQMQPFQHQPVPRMHQAQVFSEEHNNAASSVSNSPIIDETQGGVLIYIDNSNIWINTMEHSAKCLKFRNDIRQDQRTRVNIHRLLHESADGRPIIRAVLYGSEPPPVSKFWNNVKENKFCKVDVQVTHRSTYSNREREVDQNIMLDIGEDIVIHQNHTKHEGTIIIFTGDGGMIAAVRRALKYNWNVEVWAYRNSLAKEYIEEEQKEEKFTIKYLDDHFQNLVYHTLEWKSQIPRERSFVITLSKVIVNKKQEILENFVKVLTELVRMPMAGRYLKDREGTNSKFTHFAIVCSVGKLILKEDSRDRNDKESDNNNQNNHQLNNYPKKSIFQFNQEQWDRILSFFISENVSSDVQLENPRLKHDIESVVQEAIKTNANILDNPKYDFNSEVYQKIEHFLDLEKINSVEMTRDLQDNLTQVLKKHKPIILRSLPQFLQDMRIEDHPDIEHPVTSPANDDDGQGGYTVCLGRKYRVKNKFQKYSSPCKHSYRCVNGFKCTFSHTDKEKEFFKIQPDEALRRTYKFKACDHYKNQKCKYSKGLAYICPFSHGTFCLHCKTDEDGGHDASLCPHQTEYENGHMNQKFN